MRNDLINRKNAIESIWSIFNNTYNDSSRFKVEETELAREVLADVQKMIENQPTAYDVDKVMEQLKQIKTDNSCKNCTYKEKCDESQEFYNPSDQVDLCALVTKELSIQIAKSGGIE